MRMIPPSGVRAIATGLLVASAALLPGCGHKKPSTQTQVANKLMFGERLIQAQRYVEAEKMFRDAQHLEPNNPTVYYDLGLNSFYLGELAAAEKSLRESLRLNKRNPEAHNLLGLVYNQQGDHQRALEEYQIPLDDPAYLSKESVLLNIATCLDAMGKSEDAIAKLRNAVERNPRYYPAHYELAKLLDRLDQTRDAIEEYEVAAPEYATDPNWHYRLGLAYFRDHNVDKAREHLNKVVAGLPGSEKAVKAKEYLELMKADPAPRAEQGAGAPR